ncbi:MAG: hypothetical protein JNN13_12070 [Planctomycetes bacterium]|nr:hypothetical protein [Planctomycetota bacterium]
MNSRSRCVLPSRGLLLPAIFSWAMLTAGTARAQFGFNGLEQQCQLGGNPPTVSLDTPTASIANSYNYIVEVANSQIAVYQRSAPYLLWRNNLGGMPMAGGGCSQNATSFFGTSMGATRIVDTKVLYDATNQRFAVIGMQQDSSTPGAQGTQGLYVAWSNSDNPLPGLCGGGDFHIWHTPMPNLGGTVSYQPDFNGVGQTQTHVIWSGIMQPRNSTTAPSYVWYRWFRKSDLSSAPSGGTLPYGEFFAPRATNEFAHAADSFDPASNMVLASVVVGGNALRLVTVNLGNSTEIPHLLPVAPFIPASGQAPQPGGTFLDTIDGRMQSAVLRNGYLYCCHTVMSGSQVGARHVVRWYQIALNNWPMVGGTPQVVQWGDIDLGGTLHAFMPSLAVNQDGTVLVTFARSSTTVYPGIGWAARRSFDLPGTMPQGGVALNGTSSYTSSNGTGMPNTHRWGDWSSVVIDGSNPWRFVICGSYAQSGGTPCAPQQANRWRTWIHTVFPNGSGQTTVNPGFGSPGTGGVVPALSVYPSPRLGSSPVVTVANPSGVATAGVGLIGLAPLAPGAMPTGFGGSYFVDPASAATLFFACTPSSGQFTMNVPFDPALISVSFYLQGAVFDAGAASGVAVSDGVRTIVGA